MIRDRVEVPQEKKKYIYIYIYLYFPVVLRPDLGSWISPWEVPRSYSGHTTFGTTSLGKSSPQRRDLYLAPQNTQKRPISMPPARLEPAIPASQRLQTHALDCAATGIGHLYLAENIKYMKWWISSILFIICFNDEIFLNTLLKLSSPQNIGLSPSN